MPTIFPTDRLRSMIAANRRNPLLRAVAAASVKYLRAYNNELNWSVGINGERSALKSVLADNPGCIIDVGANIGQWATMVRSFDQDRPIHCFEISPVTFGALQKRASKLGNCVLNQIGLSDRENELELNYYPDSPDRSSVIRQPDGFRKETQKVRVTTGDAYVRDAGIDAIAFLKIDVEGHELAVLAGFDQSLRSGRIAAVQFEHGPAHVISRHFLADFVSFFEARSYAVMEIFPNAMSPLNYSHETSENFTGRNYLAVRVPGRG